MSGFPTIEQTLVSVIVPTRDRPKFLLEAVRSVLAQTLRPLELLVVDDGSGDQVAEALTGLQARAGFPIQVLKGSARGPAAARNVGLRQARGELAAFLDDDDVWMPEKLAWQAAAFARGPRLGLVGTHSVRTEGPVTPSPGGRKMPRRLRRISEAALLRGNRLVTSSVVARRVCFQECGGFDESLPLAQDWDMWLRIAERWEIGIVPARLTLYRLHSDQRSANSLRMRFCEAEVMTRALRRGRLAGRWEEGVARRRLAWAHCRIGRRLAREGDRQRCLRELKQAKGLLPYHPAVWGALARCALAARALAGARQP